jgi:hypothetical protein
MRRNGIFLTALIAILCLGLPGLGFAVTTTFTATSPDEVGGVISGGEPFSIIISMDNANTSEENCGGGFSFKLYSPDESITQITHVDVEGDGSTGSIEYLNGFDSNIFDLLVTVTENSFDGTLPDLVNFTVAGLDCLQPETPLTEYIKFNIQVDTEGQLCIDSVDNVEGGTPDWDWLFPDPFDPQEFNGPYCWTIITSDVKEDISMDGLLPEEFALGQNYPNPFNPSTKFDMALPVKSHVAIDIFNVLGQKIKTLVDEEYPAGYYTVDWDGTTDAGRAAASGIYFYRMETENYSATKKLMLLK